MRTSHFVSSRQYRYRYQYSYLAIVIWLLCARVARAQPRPGTLTHAPSSVSSRAFSPLTSQRRLLVGQGNLAWMRRERPKRSETPPADGGGAAQLRTPPILNDPDLEHPHLQEASATVVEGLPPPPPLQGRNFAADAADRIAVRIAAVDAHLAPHDLDPAVADRTHLASRHSRSSCAMA